MKISCRKKIAILSRKDAILIPVFKNIKPLRLICGKKIDDELHNIIQSDYFNFEDKEIKSFYLDVNQKMKKVYVMNAPKEQADHKTYMALGSKFASILKKDKITSVSMISFEDIYNEKKDFSSTKAFLDGLMFGNYTFDKYKTKKEAATAFEIEIITAMTKLKTYIDNNSDKWNLVFDHVAIAKDLVNTPASDITPLSFAEFVKANINSGIELTDFDSNDIDAQGLNLVSAVGRGSLNKPHFLTLKYNGNRETTNNIALVGKGVTFDSGGTNLKPSGSIETMKQDMAGAATVFAVINLIACLKLPVNVNAYIPLVENTIGGNAMRPGDVIASASGKTVEVLNTDAEGRLILADALYLATKSDPEVIVDVATLTGACIVALGPYCAGLFTNRKFLSKQFLDSSSLSCEDVWELPIYEDYEEGINSKVADMQNMSSFKREGGAIHAAIFLKQFVDNYPWVHLDIAGPAYVERRHPVFGSEATGFGVRLLYKFIKNYYCGGVHA